MYHTVMMLRHPACVFPLLLVVALGAAGCALTTRVALGPSVSTAGGFGVEARLSFGFGVAGEQTGVVLDSSLGGGAVDNMRAGTLSGGVALSGVLIADTGPSGRLGFGFVGRRVFAEGTSRGSQGIGLTLALHKVLNERHRQASLGTPLGRLPAGQRHGFFLLGGQLGLDWVWGGAGSFGTLWLPVVFEYWRFATSRKL